MHNIDKEYNNLKIGTILDGLVKNDNTYNKEKHYENVDLKIKDNKDKD